MTGEPVSAGEPATISAGNGGVTAAPAGLRPELRRRLVATAVVVAVIVIVILAILLLPKLFHVYKSGLGPLTPWLRAHA